MSILWCYKQTCWKYQQGIHGAFFLKAWHMTSSSIFTKYYVDVCWYLQKGICENRRTIDKEGHSNSAVESNFNCCLLFIFILNVWTTLLLFEVTSSVKERNTIYNTGQCCYLSVVFCPQDSDCCAFCCI